MSLDQERTEKLAGRILLAIRANYLRGPIAQERIYENLNALAFCAAHIIKGCDGPGGEAEKFFLAAYYAQNAAQGDCMGVEEAE